MIRYLAVFGTPALGDVAADLDSELLGYIQGRSVNAGLAARDNFSNKRLRVPVYKSYTQIPAALPCGMNPYTADLVNGANVLKKVRKCFPNYGTVVAVDQ